MNNKLYGEIEDIVDDLAFNVINTDVAAKTHYQLIEDVSCKFNIWFCDTYFDFMLENMDSVGRKDNMKFYFNEFIEKYYKP